MLPVLSDSLSQVLYSLCKGLPVGVCNLKDILVACSQFLYSSTHDPRVIFDHVKVAEVLIPRHLAQSIVTFVLKNDPLVVVGSKVCFYHPFFLCVFLLIICSIFIIFDGIAEIDSG